MSPTELLQRAKRRLDTLSPEHLKSADDFLAYLENRDQRESAEATAELLATPGFLDALRQAEDDIAAGRLTALQDLERKPQSRRR